jgi:hypothetical protein
MTLFMGKVPDGLQKPGAKEARTDKIYRFDEIFATICDRHRNPGQSYLRPSFKAKPPTDRYPFTL